MRGLRERHTYTRTAYACLLFFPSQRTLSHLLLPRIAIHSDRAYVGRVMNHVYVAVDNQSEMMPGAN